MERLLFAFVFIGTTLACSPVPEPKVKGKGHDIVYVTLVTNKTYNPAGISTFLSDFSQTKIQQYSASVGNFSDLNCTNTDGYFTWTFKLTDANCSIVKAWVNQIVNSSSFYQYGETSCSKVCSPVPEPKLKGKGDEIASVYIFTNQTYNPARISQFLSAFSGTEIKQYSASLGDFSDLSYTYDKDGYFIWTFALTNANCSIVDAWMEQIQESSSCYRSAFSGCLQTGTSTSANANLIEITTPPPTAARPTPFVIVPGGALPVAPVVIPYQSDYEETVEHVEESVSSFESMSITSL